jgi:hypothetical protein
MWKTLPKEAKGVYGKEYVDHHVKASKERISESNMDITLVTEAMEEALFTVTPKARYMVGGSNHWYDKYKVSKTSVIVQTQIYSMRPYSNIR